jgi:hypothetical protein
MALHARHVLARLGSGGDGRELILAEGEEGRTHKFPGWEGEGCPHGHGGKHSPDRRAGVQLEGIPGSGQVVVGVAGS